MSPADQEHPSPDFPRGPARRTAASPLARPQSRKLGEPEFARIADYRWHGRLSDGLVAALFVAAILLPFIASWQSIRGEPELHENRNLAARPDLGLSNWARWAEQIDAYYRDHFAFRARLINWENTLRVVKLQSWNKDLLIGRERWMFFTGEGNLDNHLGLEPFSAQELAQWKQYFERRHFLLQASGSRYLLVIAPDKEAIYPEMLPDAVRRSLGTSRLTQLLTYLQQTNSPLAVLPLHNALRAAKSQGLVYFPQDTHWNGRGLFLANQEIARYAQAHWFPELQVPTLAPDYAIEEHAWEGGEWNMVGLPRENGKYRSEFLIPKRPPRAQARPGTLPANWPDIPQPWLRPLWYAQPQGSRRLLVLHDSFMRTGCPDRDRMPVAEVFAHSLFIGDQPDLVHLDTLVNRERPDLVVQEIVERHLRGAPRDEFVPGLELD